MSDIQSAEASFNAALDIDQSFAPALKALSKLNLHKGDIKKANDYSNKAVQIEGEDFRDWSNQIIDIVQNMPKARSSKSTRQSRYIIQLLKITHTILMLTFILVIIILQIMK